WPMTNPFLWTTARPMPRPLTTWASPGSYTKIRNLSSARCGPAALPWNEPAPPRRLFAGGVLVGGDLFFDLAQRAFFQPADLCLADADLPCDLHLCFSVQVAQGDDAPFPR